MRLSIQLLSSISSAADMVIRYGRVKSRNEDKISSTLRTVVHRILMRIACAKRPQQKEKKQQKQVVDIGADDFVRCRKDFRDIRRACGPIIEVLDGVVGFVHFSAKEYVLSTQRYYIRQRF